MYDLSDALPGAISKARKEIIAQRREIISLLKRIGFDYTNSHDPAKFPKWIRDRLRELGEEV